MAKPLTNDEGEVRELTKKDMRGFRPISEVDPGMVEAVAAWRKAGRPKAEKPKVQIGFRLPAELVDKIKSSGRGYNARVQRALEAEFG